MPRLLALILRRPPLAILAALLALVSLATPGRAARPRRPRGFLSPTVTITPGTSTFTGNTATYTVSVTVKFCSTTSANLDKSTRSFTLDGVTLDTASFSTTSGVGTGCTFSLGYIGNVVLPQTNDGVHLFQASIEDVNGYAGLKNATYTYIWPGYVAPRYAVHVIAALHTKDVASGSGQTATFTLLNTGTRSATYNLTSTCVRAASCTSSSVSPSSPVSVDTITRTAMVTVNFSGGTVGDTGAVTLAAHNTVTSLSADQDSASTDIMIPAPIANNSPGVVIAGAGDVIARDQCLTVAAGKDGAYECGDLRLAHALPTVTTRGKRRTPVLLYNSAHAVGNVVIGADVTPVTTMGGLDSVVAKVLVSGVQWGRGKWADTSLRGGVTRRIGVKIDSLKASGVYSFTLNVQYYWIGGATTTDAPTGQFVVVNRNASNFGAGWWLAGVEQLMPSGSDLLWVGGDGSAHLYRASGTNLWRATTGARPDSIYWTGAAYERTLSSGTRIEFNSAGQHVATRPLVGPATYFAYSGTSLTSPLTRITIPSGHADGDTTIRYNFTYYTDSVVAQLTAGTTTRQTVLSKSSGEVTSIRDPDATSVQFGYVAGVPYINRRTDRNSHATMYGYDAAWHLIRDSVPLVSVGTIVESFTPAESRGVVGTTTAAPQSPDSTYTLIDGPRTDVADVMRVWLNKYGGPSRIKNAYGRETKLLFDTTWPALPNEVRAPGGAITKAWYNSRGLADSTKVYNLRYSGDVGAATKYTWQPTLALPTQITGADGSVKSYGYNADGTLQYAQTGTSASTRDSIWYNTGGAGVGLYAMSNVPGRSERDSVEYDPSLGNPIQTKDRKGYWSYTTRDGLGRPTLHRAEFQAGHWRRDSTIYDLADRVANTISWADTSSYAAHGCCTYSGGQIAADTLYVRNGYDLEGQLLSVARWTHPNPAGIDTVTDNFDYDEAGRKTSEWNTAGVDIGYTYDFAGNVTLVQSLTQNVQTQFDEMGNPTQKIVGKRVFTPTSCTTLVPWGMGSDCNFSFPLQTNGGPYTVPADTLTFGYDAVGNLRRADNKSARIRRTYSPAGLLLTDSSYVRILRYATAGNTVTSTDFTSHPYGIKYGYDPAGRLDSLVHPGVLCPSPCGTQLYAYDTPTGRLTSVTDVRSKAFGFQYTAAGQVQEVDYPGSVAELTDYDAEGLVAHRTVGTPSFKFIADTLNHDPMGRVISGTGRVVRDGNSQTLYNSYSGLGAVANTETVYGSGTPKFEEFKNDGLGNQYWSRGYYVHLGGSADEPSVRDHLYDVHGRAVHVTPEDTVLMTDYNYDHYWYDNEGRTTFATHWLVDAANTPSQEAHYYDGQGRLVLIERHRGWGVNPTISNPNDIQALSEWYRYDALGRRVLVWTHHEKMTSCNVLGCESTVSRFVWAGDQLLYETRGPAQDSTASTSVESDTPGGNGEYGALDAYGTVGYTHAGGVDRPLGLVRINNGTVLTALYPHQNWRGLYETATVDDGSLYAARDNIRWPGALASAYLGATVKPDSVFYWFGTQITENGDASGMLYRRNRYYDPASGHFTQPDPAGIGGGLSSYGFGGGDPISNSDPFGLDPCTKEQSDHGWSDVKSSTGTAECQSSTNLPVVTSTAKRSPQTPASTGVVTFEGGTVSAVAGPGLVFAAGHYHDWGNGDAGLYFRFGVAAGLNMGAGGEVGSASSGNAFGGGSLGGCGGYVVTVCGGGNKYGGSGSVGASASPQSLGGIPTVDAEATYTIMLPSPGLNPNAFVCAKIGCPSP